MFKHKITETCHLNILKHLFKIIPGSLMFADLQRGFLYRKKGQPVVWFQTRKETPKSRNMVFFGPKNGGFVAQEKNQKHFELLGLSHTAWRQVGVFFRHLNDWRKRYGKEFEQLFL